MVSDLALGAMNSRLTERLEAHTSLLWLGIKAASQEVARFLIV
jgi:hypothetical protein